MERNHSTEVLSYKTLVESIPYPAVIFIANENMDIIYTNHFLWELFDCRSEEEFLEFCDGSYTQLIASADKVGMISMIREAQRINNRNTHKTIYRIITRQGVEKMIEDSGSVLEIFEDGGAVFNVLIEIKNESGAGVYDKLTGVYNREQFFVYADRMLRQAEAAGEENQYSFVYTNIRNFKFYNMKYGRHAGDLVLQDIAKRIKANKSTVMVGHYSSDHFMICSNDADVNEIIRRNNEAFDEAYEGTGLKLKTGIYRITRKGIDVEFACDFAKIACDMINDAPDSVIEYDDELEMQLKRENYIDAHFEEALQKEYIKVYYQPVIRTISGEICGAEALARWIDPEIGFLSPGEFIPVLEKKRLITKLDLYMLKQICKDMQKLMAKGIMLPVSFNLSKLDFIDCDILDEVERIVLGYGVPRDLINIEITESVVMNDPERMKQIILAFQETGYQIWMDDFGSELSSLNVLDEYNFDEIKMDMLFLRSFDDRSREIIRSVVQMSKRLGVQTLAEGVETEEQFAYLKEIGCEKVQGFYFSKPLPLDGVMQYHKESMRPVELRAMRRYYDQIGQFDHITDLPMALVEFAHKRFRFLFISEGFERISRQLGNGSFIFSDYILNSPASTLSRKFRDLQTETAYGEEARQMDYSINGKYFRLRSRCISAYGDYEANLVEIEDLSWGEVDEKREQMDYIFRIMYSMYDDIFLLDNNSVFKNVQTTWEGSLKSSQIRQLKDSYISREEICRRYVMWEDQKEFMAFTDPSGLKERLKTEPRGYETRYFRNKISNGAYIWKANTIQYISDTDMLIYSTRPAFFEQKGLMEKIAPDYLASTQERIEDTLWRSLMHSQSINLFWKDTERRFLGVNQKFLETYGYASADMLIGKTDEEMHWHVDDGPFRDDEYNVLKNGVAFKNRVGKCIIRGVLHNILASKEPVYCDGKIVGLIGCFVDLDELSSMYGEFDRINSIDAATGLLSAQGMTNVLADYIEAWTGRKENFAVIHVACKEYERAYGSYGSTIVNRMARELGDILRDIAGQDSSIARLYAGTFVLLKKYTQKAEIRQIQMSIEKRMRQVRMLAGFVETVNPVIQVVCAEDESDLQTLISFATGNTSVVGEQNLLGETDHVLYKKKNMDMVEEVSVKLQGQKEEETLASLMQKYEDAESWVYVADAETHELLYVNKVLRQIYQRFMKMDDVSLEQFAGKKCYELLHQSAHACSMCVKHRLQYNQFFEREFYDFEFDGLLRLRDKFIDVDGRKCMIEIADRISADATLDQQFRSVYADKSVLNDLLRKAMYEHEPKRSMTILLEHMGRHLRADRAFIGEIKGDMYFYNTYEWCRYGVKDSAKQRQRILMDDYAVWKNLVSRGEAIVIEDVDQIKEKIPRLYADLRNQNIQSVIIYPLWKDGKVGGFYGFDNPSPSLVNDIYPILRTIGHFIESLMVSRDLIEQLEYISYSDRMTGFGNRFALDHYQAALQDTQSMGIVFCDVSGLKRTNDTLGHAAGDELLQRAAEAIVEAFGEYDLFRAGGDEFLIAAAGISKDEFTHRVEILRHISAEKNAPLAVGSEWKENVTKDDFITIAESVDQKMYEDKAKYYARAGIDRRRK